MARLFTAIPIPEDIKEKISANYGPLSSGRWVPEKNLHLTLVFIGDYPDEYLEELKRVLLEIVFPSFNLRIKGCGTFKSGLLWLGIEKNSELQQLQKRLTLTLQELGVDCEKRKFTPHITIARSKKGHFEPYNIVLESFRSREFRVDHFNLYLSELKPTGAEYSLLDKYPV